MKAKLLRYCLASALVLYPRLYAQQDASDAKLSDLRAKAEAGDGQSQLQLAKAYQHGTSGLATNLASAVTWYRKAAAAYHPHQEALAWHREHRFGLYAKQS